MKTRYLDHVLEARPNADGLYYPYLNGQPYPGAAPAKYWRSTINRIIKALQVEEKYKLLEQEIKNHEQKAN